MNDMGGRASLGYPLKSLEGGNPSFRRCPRGSRWNSADQRPSSSATSVGRGSRAAAGREQVGRTLPKRAAPQSNDRVQPGEISIKCSTLLTAPI